MNFPFYSILCILPLSAASDPLQQHRHLLGASPPPPLPTTNPPDEAVPDLSGDADLLASIPKLTPAEGAVTPAATGGKNGTAAKPGSTPAKVAERVIPLSKFSPTWPSGKKVGQYALLVSVFFCRCACSTVW